MRTSFIWLWLGANAINFASSPAYAVQIYVDAAGGFNHILTGSTYFDSSATGTTATGGASLSLAALVKVNPYNQRFPIHFGLQHRITTGSLGTESVGLQALYLVMRVQFQQIYLSVGGTPFVWEKAGSGSGLALYSTRSVGAFAAVGEAGYEFPITPEISLAAGAATQYVRSPQISGASYMTFEYFGMFRFYYGSPPNFDAIQADRERDRSKYPGYRYPYGVPR